jgi:hypothetical protein
VLPAIDPMLFLSDENIKPFHFDERHDLTAANAIKVSTNLFVVHKHVVPKDTAEVILAVTPHCWARTDPGGANESVALMTPAQVAGWVLFASRKGNGQPYVVRTNYNEPLASAAVANDKNRDDIEGSTFLYDQPQHGASLGFLNPLTTFFLPAGTEFSVTFRLAPQTTVANGGTVKQMQIGAGAAGLRLDFAGALVSGLTMPQQLYNQLFKERLMGHLGAEARAHQR